MYRIYHVFKDETICQFNTLVELIIYINSRSDISICECYIQFYDKDSNEWVNF